MNKTAAKDKIIIALDVEDLGSAKKCAALLCGHVGAFKIGKQLFTHYGPEALQLIHGLGGRVFLDLKFHDIPSTVAKASCEAARHGVFMFNMHALGGGAMMRQAAASVADLARSLSAARPLLLAVTVLTSHGPEDLTPLGISASLDELVIRLARLAQDAGMDGVVASPREIQAIKKECGKAFLVVTPGVRPKSADLNDQKRTMTPAEAVQAGADYIVIGRPVTEAPDPLAVVRSIVDELSAI
ncbi:MAG: orotidine-5'-phosphate decarboxylase [Pseudomonadota bacterium]